MEVYQLILRVAEDTLLPSRVAVLKALCGDSKTQMTITEISEKVGAGLSKKQIRTRLKKFDALGIVDKEKKGSGSADSYKPTPEFGSWVAQSGLGKKWSGDQPGEVPF